MGLNLAFLQNSALWFYIGWEIALIPALLLVFGWGGLGRKAAGMKFLLYTVAGSLGMLASILFLFSQSGTTDWTLLSNTLLPASVQMIAFFGFFIAFAVKIPIFPFHNWQADTYSESNLPTAMLLSAAFSKLGIYGIYRLVTAVAPDITPVVAPFVIGLCVVGAIYGAILAFSQSNIKRVIAFSSMSHLNLVAAGFFAGRTLGVSGALLQSVAHVGVAIGLWWVVGILKSRFGHTRLHELPGGIVNENRWFTAVFFIIVMASMAVPLTSGFPGELLIIQGIVHRGVLFGILAAIPMILGAVYMLRTYQAVMLGDRMDATSTVQLSFVDYILGTVVVAYIFIIGLYPQLIFRLLTLN
jgi:NADH-quinone oxidoreductase subunit M